jgi:hypothetical protein
MFREDAAPVVSEVEDRYIEDEHGAAAGTRGPKIRRRLRLKHCSLVFMICSCNKLIDLATVNHEAHAGFFGVPFGGETRGTITIDQPLVKPRHKRIFYFYERSVRHLFRRMKENW